MKIGIITIHNSPNYGASLQAFSLWKYMTDCGYDCEIIDLHRPHQDDFVPSKKYVPCRIAKRRFKTRVKRAIFGLFRKKNPVKCLTDEAKEKFDKFNSQIKLSKPYLSVDELYSNPPLYDVYITGSDQLWNPTQPFCIEPYFLTFAPDRKKKVSYASSIGITELTEKEKVLFRESLRRYDAISVREIQAKVLLEKIVGKDIVQVADPTFLLPQETWKANAVYPRMRKKFLLLFTLAYNAPLLEYALHLSFQSGLKVVYLTSMQPPGNEMYESVVNAGPREWLGYIAHAEMVITDSFHGTVFSIIMGTNNFFTHIAKSNHRGSRITSLLHTFGLSDHLLKQELNQNYNELMALRVNHERVAEIIQEERRYSQGFLTQHLS